MKKLIFIISKKKKCLSPTPKAPKTKTRALAFGNASEDFLNFFKSKYLVELEHAVLKNLVGNTVICT